MLPTFGDLYAMAFSWDATSEFQSVRFLLDHAGIPQGLPLIDAGAGTGRFLAPILAAGFDVISVEPDLAMYRRLCDEIRKNIPEADHGRITCVHTPFETFDAGRPVSAVITMTDTLSYVVPRSKQREFFAQAHASLASGGAFIIDVGLWSGYEGESRSETWSSFVAPWQVTAWYTATVHEGDFEDQLPRKQETLTFEGMRNGQLVERMHQQENAAITSRYLLPEVQAAGFEYVGAVEPGSDQLIDIQDAVFKRAFICFRKP